MSTRSDRSSTTPVAHVLSNGRLTTLVTGAGGGFTMYGAFALTRWVPDRTRDADGSFVYVRDVERGTVWSATRQPFGDADGGYAYEPGRARFEREHDGIGTVLDVCVAPDADVELRRLMLTNHGEPPRRLDVTTYAEAVLNTPAGDASHPAFSKLFVQTEYDAAHDALLAKRRPRSPVDPTLWVAHALRIEDAARGERAEYETDRMRFIGRGRTLAAPRALDPGVRLEGSIGNVLDPVLAMRRTVTLGPGATVRLVALLAAAPERDGATALLARFGGATAIDDAFDGAARRAGLLVRPPEDPLALHRAIGALAYADPSAGDVSAWRTPRDDAQWCDAARAIVKASDSDTLRARITPTRHPRESGDLARRSPGHREIPASAGMTSEGDAPLQFFNGHGGFTADGTEYVIRLAPGDAGPVRPPLPWANVAANERVGFIATETGAMYTWSANSRENRLTPWLNDPVMDPHGEALYLRDEASGACWSPTPGPIAGPGPYETRHGMGYTRWRTTAHDLESEVLAFVPRFDPVKIVRLRVTNRGTTPRRVAAFSYAQLVLGVFPWETGPSVETRAEDGAILAVNPKNGEFAPLVAFAAAHGGAVASFTADRAEFLGALGGADRPAAVAADRLSGRVGAGLDPCAALRVLLDVAPGETGECVFLLGQGADAAEARTIAARYREPSAVEAALDVVRAFWRDMVGGVQVETPSPALDLMVNGWLTYQNLSCRVWGRSAYYQSGGAFGFRDQLQDTAALVHLAPELTRRQIVLHAAHQFVEGDVLHWWHPPTSKGMRTRFADDLLWLPYVAAYYVQTTGDASVLDEEARFVTAHQLAPGEDEEFLVPRDSGTSATVYEHCCRALDRSLTAGAHGLPLMGVGDWNDGMNRVGREGRGESVWLGFFLAAILDDFIPLCEWRGDRERAERYGEYAQRLRQSLNADGEGWDGAWYRRAYYDDGTPLGASTNDECRIDTIAQAWAVISRVAPPEKAEQALDAMERHLVSEREGIIRLLTPAFDRTPHDPGYIKGYLPGVRENGGQYTHGALWAVKALAELGRTERAARLLEMLSPVTRGATADAVGVYRVEPYVIAADVYGVAPHVGRGGWTWYTGSAGWMFRVALESVLGVELVGGDTLVVRPCIPRDWPGFTVRYRLADRSAGAGPAAATTYEIVVTRGAGATTARGDAGTGGPTVDRGAVRIPVQRGGGTHRVEIALGSDVVPRYAAR